MAADTAKKRYSAMNIGCSWRGQLPLPDGVTGSGDRAMLLFLYAGIPADSEGAATPWRPIGKMIVNAGHMMVR